MRDVIADVMAKTMDPNPYTPPMTVSEEPILPRQFRVRNSRATLREWQNLCGSRVLGAIGWLQAKITFGLLDRQTMDAPKPFLADLCDVACLPDRIRNSLLEIVEDAKVLGFDHATFSISRSTGIPCIGGAVRMRHPSGDVILQSVASSAGPLMRRETHLISASYSGFSLETYATSNGGPKYKRPPGAHAQYFRGCELSVLLKRHRDWPILRSAEFIRILTLQELGEVMDEMAAKYYRTMIERGIIEPEP
jgi:hypothetical protein